MARDAAPAARIRAMRNHGRGAPEDWFEHTELGFNYRLSDIACALGSSQLGRIEAILARRAAVAGHYDERLRGRGEFILPSLKDPGGGSAGSSTSCASPPASTSRGETPSDASS